MDLPEIIREEVEHDVYKILDHSSKVKQVGNKHHHVLNCMVSAPGLKVKDVVMVGFQNVRMIVTKVSNLSTIEFPKRDIQLKTIMPIIDPNPLFYNAEIVVIGKAE